MIKYILKFKYLIVILIFIILALCINKSKLRDRIYNGYVPIDTLSIIKLKHEKEIDSLNKYIYISEAKLNNITYSPIYIKKHEKNKNIIKMLDSSSVDDDIKYFREYFSN